MSRPHFPLFRLSLLRARRVKRRVCFALWYCPEARLRLPLHPTLAASAPRWKISHQLLVVSAYVQESPFTCAEYLYLPKINDMYMFVYLHAVSISLRYSSTIEMLLE